MTNVASINPRFFGGNLLATGGQLTIHDLQIYNYPLSNAQVMSLSNGRGSSC